MDNLEIQLREIGILLEEMNKDQARYTFSEGKYNDAMKKLMSSLGYGANDSFKLSEIVTRVYEKASEK